MTDTFNARHTHCARPYLPRIVVLVLLLVVAGSAAPRASSGPPVQSGSGKANRSSSAAKHVARLDTAIADLLAHGSDRDHVRVIITVKPGTKRGLIQALRAHGATVSGDFTIIEAFAADIPVGLLRALQVHQDVVAISSDADVTSDGLSTGV